MGTLGLSDSLQNEPVRAAGAGLGAVVVVRVVDTGAVFIYLLYVQCSLEHDMASMPSASQHRLLPQSPTAKYLPVKAWNCQPLAAYPLLAFAGAG